MFDPDLEDFLSPDYDPNATKEKEEQEQIPKLFDYINDLSFKKENLAYQIKEKTGVFPSEFVPYVAIKAFGNFRDTVLFANLMNCGFKYIQPEYQYLFYLYGIPKKRRFGKFFSYDKDREETILAVAKYFHIASGEAEKNLHMFSPEELKYIRNAVKDKQCKIKSI